MGFDQKARATIALLQVHAQHEDRTFCIVPRITRGNLAYIPIHLTWPSDFPSRKRSLVPVTFRFVWFSYLFW